jgi:phosphotransferase system  glucose/maltose/N-acetylglucosamine-specific IIC component
MVTQGIYTYTLPKESVPNYLYIYTLFLSVFQKKTRGGINNNNNNDKMNARISNTPVSTRRYRAIKRAVSMINVVGIPLSVLLITLSLDGDIDAPVSAVLFPLFIMCITNMVWNIVGITLNKAADKPSSVTKRSDYIEYALLWFGFLLSLLIACIRYDFSESPPDHIQLTILIIPFLTCAITAVIHRVLMMYVVAIRFALLRTHHNSKEESEEYDEETKERELNDIMNSFSITDEPMDKH